MMRKRALLIAFIVLLAGCQSPAPSVISKATTYVCEDGRSVQAVYRGRDTAVLTFNGQSHRLHIAVSADGARYVGNDWQWWTKGMNEARLAPLKAGETIAAAGGVSCRAP